MKKKIIRIIIKLKTLIYDKKIEQYNFSMHFFTLKNHKCKLKNLCMHPIK
jgi:hypothetical protein